MSIPRDRGPQILEHVAASGITLIEWETNESRFFLVPDDQIPKVQEAVAELGFSPAGEDILSSQYACERLGPAIRYQLRPALPPSTLTVPLPAACAALARIAARTQGPTASRTHDSSMSLQFQLVDHISGIVTYSLFDMSYEGDYMVHLPNSVPLSDAEVREIEQAVATVQGWKLREEDQWVKDTLVDIFKGKKDYLAFLPRCAEKSEGAKS